MNELTRHTRTDATVFEPQKALETDAQADAMIDLGKRIQDWAAVDMAVDAKLDNQEDLVNWWRENVSSNWGGSRIKIRGPQSWNASKAEEITGITKEQVSRWAKRLQDRQAYRAAIVGAAYRKAMNAAHNHGALGTGENEWYTPAEYLEAARSAMGGIDLDPASSEAAQANVQAASFFTAQDSGLEHEWHGRVWMNPPYAQPLISLFIEKLIAEVAAGRVDEAIVLTHNSTDTLWFHRLEEIAAAICFTRGRVAFVDPQGSPCQPTQGQAFFYCGQRTYAFAEVFIKFGFIR